jgi:diguanylate cyclase (GGDEF)-like protein/PAS domain S-box-containing protein
MRQAKDEIPIATQSLWELEAIFQHASIGIAFTRNRVITRCNRAMEEALGFEHGALNGCSTSSMFPTSEEYQRFAKAVANSLQQGKTTGLTWTFHGKHGRPVICKISATPMEAGPGEEGTVWLFDDISQEHRQSQELQRSHAALQAVMSNAPVAILFTKDRRITNCNDKFCEMFGYTYTSAIGAGGRELYASDEDYAALGQLAAPLLSVGKPFSHELTMVRQNGEKFWAQMVAYVLDAQDSAQGTVWIISDRSAEKAQAQRMQHALFENEAILNNVTVGIVFLKERVVQRCNPFAERLFGFEAGTMVGTSSRLWYLSKLDFDAVGQDLYPRLSTAHACTTERLFRRRNGESFWGRMSGRLIQGGRAQDDASIWAIEDTTEQHQTEEALREAIGLTQAVFNSANVSIIATDIAGTITLINATASQWLGYTSEEVVGIHTPSIIHEKDEVISRANDLSAELEQAVVPGFDVFVVKARMHGTDEHEWTYIRKDGSRFPVQLAISSLRNESGEITGYLGIGMDITDRRRADEAIHLANEVLEQRVAERTTQIAEANKQLQLEIALRTTAEQEMRRMAHFDALTGLPNRLLLSDRLQQGLINTERRSCMLAVAYLDLDGFKAINDVHGHAIGDRLLVQLAERLNLCLREVDTFARLGGDEFVAVLTDLENVGASVPVLERLLQHAAQAIHVDSHKLHVSASIGVTYFPQRSAVDAEQLLRQADQAMYHAKLLGKNRYAVFDSDNDISVRGHHASLERMRQALASNEFVLFYQPKVNMRTRAFVGVEALIRWQHPQDGLLAPGQFLPLIENNPLSVRLGEWVIEQALQQLKQWQQAGTMVPISVNVGALQLQQCDFTGQLQQALARYPDYQPYSLELEILETSALEEIEQVSRLITQCATLGVGFALDDFGTGYSSLTYLNRLPVPTIKIDQSFVREMLRDRNNRSILDGILWIMRQLNRCVIAEGVETLEHGRMLMDLGCDFAQGYGIARPMPADKLAAWLVQWQNDAAWQEVASVPRTAI